MKDTGVTVGGGQPAPLSRSPVPFFGGTNQDTSVGVVTDGAGVTGAGGAVVPDAPGAEDVDDGRAARPSSVPEPHSYNLTALEISDADRADVEAFANAAAAVDLPQHQVRAAVHWSSRLARGEPVTLGGLCRSLGNDVEAISDVVRIEGARSFPDGARATLEEVAAARGVYARLPEPLRQALYVTGPKGEAAPGNDSRVIRMLAGWAKALTGASDAAAPSGSAADRFAAAAEAEIAHLQPGAAKPALSAADQAELERHRRDMAAPRGSPEHRRYWERGGEKRYRELLQQR